MIVTFSKKKVQQWRVDLLLFMQRLSQQMYEQSEKDFDLDFRKYIEANFKRFLDDCFLIFTRS